MRIETNATINNRDINIPCSIARNGSKIKLQWTVPESGSYIFNVFIHTGLKSPTPFVPSVWYQGNIKGEGAFPSRKISEKWAFAENRIPCAGLICLSDSNHTAISKISCAHKEEELSTVSWDKDTIIYSIPGTEQPYSYQGKTSLIKLPATSGMQLEKGETYSREITFKLERQPDCLIAYELFLREQSITQDCRYPYSWNDYGCAKLVRILNLIQRDENGDAYLLMGSGNEEKQSIYNFTAASFLVKSLEAASALLRTDERLFNSENKHLKAARKRLSKLFNIEDNYQMLFKIASRISDFFLKGEIRPGLFQDNYNIETGELGGYLGIGEHPEFKHMVNSRCNGEAMSAYLDIYGYTKDERILTLCIRVADFYISHQLPDGNFGRWWNLDGECINSSGTNGAYIAAFLIKLLKYHENEEIKAAINKSLNYYKTLALSGGFYGDTLDADSSDKEAGVSLMGLFLEALESNIGERSSNLEAAQYSASYIASYIFQDELFIPCDSPLKKAGFSFKGMTSVSIAHHHLDFYGMLIANDFIRLAKISIDEFYTKQALLMANACRQLIGDEQNGYLSRDPSFYGWQPEQINYTQWEYFSRAEKMNGHYDIDIAWLNVLGYSAYLKIKDYL